MTELNELFPLTHKHLVNAAYKWILKSGSCGVAFREFKTICYEIPDVIGFGRGRSLIVECKASRSDYFADAKKPFRVHPALGMGLVRYYCTPEGLITKEELPEGWGLLYVNKDGNARAHHKPIVDKINQNGNPYRAEYYFERHIEHEHALMYSALRRLHLRGLIEEIYTDPEALKQQP